MLATQYRGYSLLEMMVAMAVGTLMMLAILQTYPQLVSQSRLLYRTYRLEQAVRQALVSLEKDLRRAGFSLAANSSASLRISQLPSESPGSCLLVNYDINHNGQIELTGQEAESFGYRLHGGGLEHQRGTWSCQQGIWEKLLDPAEIKVTQFTISQQLHNIKKKDLLVITLQAHWHQQHQISTRITLVIRANNL